MLDWQLFLPLGAAVAAAAFHLVNQRAYRLAYGAFVIAAFLLGMTTYRLNSSGLERTLAGGVLFVLLVMMLGYVRSKQSPIVAKLSIGPEHLWPQPNRGEFGIQVELRNGPEDTQLMGDWRVEVIRVDGSASMACSNPTTHGDVSSLATMKPYQLARGLLSMPFCDAFPDDASVQAARFIISTTPTRGRIQPAYYNVAESRAVTAKSGAFRKSLSQPLQVAEETPGAGRTDRVE